jgi:hypothetical protein
MNNIIQDMQTSAWWGTLIVHLFALATLFHIGLPSDLSPYITIVSLFGSMVTQVIYNIMHHRTEMKKFEIASKAQSTHTISIGEVAQSQ